METLETIVRHLKKGVKKISLEWKEMEVTAYWVKDIIRIDLKPKKGSE